MAVSADVRDGFRVDAGDVPEMRVYLPGHAGTLRWGVSRGGTATWLAEMASVTTRYGGGRVRYEIRDEGVLGRGALLLEVQTEAAGFEVMVRAEELPTDASLFWVFGGSGGGARASGVSCGGRR